MILFGCDDGMVGILNLKNKKVDLEYRDHDPAYQVKAVSFNCLDTLVASGSSDGEFIVRTLQTDVSEEYGLTEVIGAPAIFKDKSERSPLNCCKFSYTKRHVLAVAFDSGVIKIFDFSSFISGKEENPLRHRFTTHTLACTGVTFSPVNNLLLCSAGLDGKIQFYDIVEGKEVKKIQTQ